MLGPLLSVVFIIIGARLLLKKHNPQAVLLTAGLLMLTTALLLGLPFPTLFRPTGAGAFDLFAVIKESYSNTNAGVGLMIMAIGGFVAYMDKIGATADTLARLATTPFDISITRGVVSSVQDDAFSLGTQLYPNPATDLVNIMLPGTENSLVVVRLLNATGQQVQQFQLDNLQSDRISIDLASHPNGIYLLSVQADDKIAIKRLVIQR